VPVSLGTKDVAITIAPRQRGTIVGSVRDWRTQEPVTGAQVLVWQVETAWGDRVRPTLGAYGSDLQSGKGLVDAGGRFTLEDVPAGVATLQVYAKGYGLALHDNVNVRSGQTTETTVFIEGAGTLEVHIVPLGSLAEVESECWLELSPVGVVDLVDDSRWSSPNGSFVSGPDRRPSEVTASMRFAINCGQVGGQGVEYKTKDPRVAKFELQPGDYTVRASMRDQRVVQEADGSWNNFRAKVYRELTTRVVSGQTTLATLEIGGTGIVQGSVPPPDADAGFVVALTPGEDSEFFRAHEDIIGHDVMPLFTQTMGVAMFMTLSGGEYRFYHVALGTHTVSLYVRTEEGYVLRGTRVVEVTSEGPAVADF